MVQRTTEDGAYLKPQQWRNDVMHDGAADDRGAKLPRNATTVRTDVAHDVAQ
jgi:hypothetical protein